MRIIVHNYFPRQGPRRLGDAEWHESDHPRGQPGNAGQFGPGGGGGGKSKPVKSPSKGREKLDSERSSRNEKIAPRASQEKGIDGLAKYLRMTTSFQDKHLPKGVKSRDKFVLDNGQPFVANGETYKGKRGPMKMCYMNATKEALDNPDRTYVEGFVSVHGVPIQHAWTVDKTGQIYDPTINPDQGISGYFGVPFSTDYLLKASLKNGVYGLLGHESRKTLTPLLEGNAKDFKAKVDVDSLSDEVITDRLAFADRTVKGIKSTDKIDTPERHDLRMHIADTLYNKDIEKRVRNREATIILGLPGSGKSTFANPLLSSGALEIEGDNAKTMLPEFGQGEGAFAVHEEGSGIMREVLQKAIGNGDNLVWPRIDSPDKIVADVKSLKDAGYVVNVKYIDTSADTAIKSAVKRFLKMGRYVSPQMIKDYGNKPKESYEAALKTGLLSSHEVHRRGSSGGFEQVK